MVPLDKALRDVTTPKHVPHRPNLGLFHPVAWLWAQLLEIKMHWTHIQQAVFVQFLIPTAW